MPRDKDRSRLHVGVCLAIGIDLESRRSGWWCWNGDVKNSGLGGPPAAGEIKEVSTPQPIVSGEVKTS